MSVPPPPENASLPSFLRRLPVAAGIIAVCVGLFVLLGWQIDSEFLKRLALGLVATNPLTAITFLFGGVALIFAAVAPRSYHAIFLVRILAAVISVIGLLKLSSLAGDQTFPGIDTWFFTAKLPQSLGTMPNRMAPNTAVNFVLLGLALFSLQMPFARLWLAQACAILIGFGALLPLTGYAYGVHSFAGFASFIPMALPTALTFLCLSLGIFFSITEAPLSQIFASNDPRGVIARRLLPLSILLTLFLGWLRLWGERRGYYERDFGTLLFAIALCLIFVVLVRWTVGTVSRLECERAFAQARLTDLNRRKDEMVAIVSHDLCSPLTGFQMVIEMLREAEGKPGDELLDMMDHSARRMVSMVRGLLESTRQQPVDESLLEYTDLRVSDVVRESMEPLRINANAKHIQFELEVEPDEPMVGADRLRVSQIFNNLLSNAVKFTPEGGSVRVRVEPAFAGVRVQVEDSGIGIPEKDLPHIFDRYYRGGNKPTAGEPGVGLGLAVAREMALLHNGYLDVKSEPGIGSTFTVYLPDGLQAAAA